MKVPFFNPPVGEEEAQAVAEVIRSRWMTFGKKTEEFEVEFAKYIGAPYVVMLDNCTAALYLACEYVFRHVPREERKSITVRVPSLTCAATALAPLHAGLNLELADLVPGDSFLMQDDGMSWSIPVSYAGRYCRASHPVVEDFAHRIERNCFTGVLQGYSFYATKNITCFPAGTRIVVEPRPGRGISCSKPIEEIKEGELVLTYNTATGAKEFEPVQKTLCRQYEGEMISLTLSNGNEIKMTSEHPVFVHNKGWIRADRIVRGDQVMQYKYRGLALRLVGKKQKGKSYEDFMDSDRIEFIKSCQRAVSGVNHPLFGKSPSAETRRKIGLGNKGKTVSETFRVNARERSLKQWQDTNFRKRMTEKMKIVSQDLALRQKKSERMYKLMSDPEYRKKLSAGVRRAMEKQSYWDAYIKGMNMSPNKQELKLGQLLNRVCPDAFEFNGDCRLQIRVDNLIPDFVCREKKKAIELFGRRWHKTEEERERKLRFKRQGYDCLVVWDNELDSPRSVEQKVGNFFYNPNAMLVTVTDIKKTVEELPVYNLETAKNHNYFAYGILVHNCGEGGAIACATKEEADWFKQARLFGDDKALYERQKMYQTGDNFWWFESVFPGWKANPTDIMAAMGLVQLKKVDQLNTERKRVAEKYNQAFGLTADRTPWHLYPMLVNDRDQFMHYMREKEISCSVHFPPLHKMQAFKADDSLFPVTNQVYEHIVSLPLFPFMPEDQQDYVIESVLGWEKDHGRVET